MKLWLLRPIDTLPFNPWDPWYHCAFGFVVRADTEQEARKFASDNGGEENSEQRTDGNECKPWLNPDYSTCEELWAEGEVGLVIRDFAAA